MNKRPDDQADDLRYEDFDDAQRPGDDELAPIDLDALDDEIEPIEIDAPDDKIAVPNDEIEPVAIDAPDKKIAALNLDALDDEIEPVEQDTVSEPILDLIAELDDEIEVTSAEKSGEDLAEKAEKIEENVSEEVAAPIASDIQEPAPEPEKIPEPEAVEKPPRKRKRAAKVKVEETPPADEAPETILEEPAAVAEAEAKPETAAQEAVTAVPEVVYRVMIPLPDDLAGTVLDLRKTSAITEMPPPGIELAAAFHAADLVPVQEALSAWARSHLPLQLETTAVLAEVIGSRQYVAAWMLQPEEELHDAQRDLMRSLELLISPLPDAPAAFHVQVTIGDHVMPKPFPHLIGQMQRDFEPFVWDAETVLLVQFTPGSEAAAWEPVDSFR